MNWFQEVCSCPSMQRIKDIGMNCGCEYTSFPRFRKIGGYSRYVHSVGVGKIVYEHTGDVRQSIAGLLHDVATPVFAHVIDFMNGDHMKQESTEGRTLEIISSDKNLVEALRKVGLKPEDVCDYHLFPIADNDTPKLSADRLEYTLGNMVNYGLASREEADSLYADIFAGENEEGAPELVFRSEDAAVRFAFLSLACSKIYVSDEDRYAMQMLAELVKKYVELGAISEDDLWSTESRVIDGICATAQGSADWAAFRAMHRMKVGACALSPDGEPAPAGTPAPGILLPDGTPDPRARIVNAKKRHINPFVAGKGRVTALSAPYQSALQDYLSRPFTYWISAD